MDRVLKVPVFNRWMKKADLTDQALIKAIDEMKDGLIDADINLAVARHELLEVAYETKK